VRVAVVDIGSNSTRLLVADVDPSARSVFERVRRSEVTRLGAGVDATGRLSPEAAERVYAALSEYRREIDRQDVDANVAVMTSAVRDASNGAEFARSVRERFQLDAHILSGDEEAQLTFAGAMSARGASGEETVVIDIGGGSTEFVIGRGGEARFHTSLHAGVVRMSERHLHSDPPTPAEVEALAVDARDVFERGLPAEQRRGVTHGIAVAGTATSAASIDQQLDPYDPEYVNGYWLALATVERMRERLAALEEAGRRRVVGLNPDRAPTIVAGMVLLAEAIRAFGLEGVEVSEHDILYGGALALARGAIGVQEGLA